MTTNEKIDEKTTLQAFYSDNSPYVILFEEDEDGGYVYAAILDSEQQADIEDVVELYTLSSEFILPFNMPQDLSVIWSENGEKAGVLIQETFHAVFDFSSKTTYSKSLDMSENNNWKRVQFEYRADIISDFNFALTPEPKALLEASITESSNQENEGNRLNLYKAIMKSSVFVPISSNETDITHNYLVFPQENNQVVLAVFTDKSVLHSILGDDVHVKSIPCSSLFRLLQGRDIAAVSMTNSTGQTAMIDESEFSILSFATNINQLNYSETVRSLSTILLKEPELEVSHTFFQDIQPFIKDYAEITHAYVFQSSAEDSSVALGLVLSKREERRLVSFYKECRQLNKKYFNDESKVELSVLKEGEHLLHAVRERTEALFIR